MSQNEKTVLKNLIENSEKIMLINHRKMDWDAYWAVIWLYYVLKKLGKEVRAVNDMKPSQDFSFIIEDGIMEASPSLDNYNPDLIISLDAASIDQLWEIYEQNKKFFFERPFAVIDHHPSNPRFGSVNIVEPEKSSTCEIVYNLLVEYWYENLIDSDIASGLLMWIITDTNSFYNTNSTPESMEVAWKLLDLWGRHQEIIVNLFKKKPYSRLKLWGRLMETIKDINGEIIWNVIPKELFESTWTTIEDTGWFIDEFLTTISGSKVLFLIYELPDGKIKGSFRSKDDKYNMSEFCELFWWGGHVRASGFAVAWKNIHEVENEVVNKLKELYF